MDASSKALSTPYTLKPKPYSYMDPLVSLGEPKTHKPLRKA